MANLKLDLNKEVSFGKKSHGSIPTKTSINLVIKKESFFSSKKALPTIIIGALVLVLLIGLLFVKPLLELTSADARIADLQSQLDETNQMIDSMGAVEEEYAHYTTEGMTEEELSRVDRVKVMKLVEDAVVNSGNVRSWNITENTMTLDVRGASLSELNQIAAAIEKESIVDRCVINTANKGTTDNEGGVTVTFIVYLNNADSAQEADQTAETKTAADDNAKTQEGQEQ